MSAAAMNELPAGREVPAGDPLQARIRPGYKQTEVGVIPEDWNLPQLGEVAIIQRGASHRPIDSPIWFDENSSGWVRISDVTKARIYLRETTQRLSALGIQHSRPVSSGSLIMSICATIGRPVIAEIETCIHDGFVTTQGGATQSKEGGIHDADSRSVDMESDSREESAHGLK